MAPSAVETTTNLVSDTPKVKLYSGHVEGAYKELAPTTYTREAEEKGIDGHAAAKVSYPDPIVDGTYTYSLVSQLPSHMEQRPSLSSPRTLRAL